MTKEERKDILKDAEVAEALYKLATEGFNYVETKELKDGSGKVFQIETTTKHVPPSVEAQIFWLTNRQPGKWKCGDEAMAQLFGKVQDQLDEYFQHKPH
jgi:hypothetical protein